MLSNENVVQEQTGRLTEGQGTQVRVRPFTTMLHAYQGKERAKGEQETEGFTNKNGPNTDDAISLCFWSVGSRPCHGIRGNEEQRELAFFFSEMEVNPCYSRKASLLFV